MSDELTVIAGRYELSSLVGEGGMASVWRAKDLTLARPVAVKLLYARDDRDRQALVDRFLREARIAASVQHRNVVHIVDFGTTEDATPYMVMELLEGENLGERLSGNPPLTTSEFVHVAGMTLRGLAAVHAADIVHRDLKPENIFLIEENGQPFPKILDFGISRSVQPASGRRSALTTKEGVIVGTPEYMSPEQARGVRTIDHRTDIYSMGAILYEGLTGRVPFEAENVGDLIIEIVTGDFVPVRELNPSIPQALSDVVSRALARDPADRYQTAEEMQVALLEAAQELAQFQRALSDFPPPGASSPQLRVKEAKQTDSLEFRITTDGEPTEPTAPSAALPARSPQMSDTAPTTAEMEPFAVLADRRRKRWWVLAGALLLGTAGGILWGGGDEEAEKLNVVSVETPDGTEAPAEPRAAAPTPAAMEPQAPDDEAAGETDDEAAEPATIQVKLDSLPPGATVSVDGEPAGEPPLTLPRDGKPHALVVRAQTGGVWEQELVADANQVLEVKLPPPPAPARPVARRVSAKKAQGHRKTQAKKKMPSALRQLDF